MKEFETPTSEEQSDEQGTALSQKLKRLEIRKTKAEIHKTKVETEQLQLPWYRKHVYLAILSPLATGLMLTWGAWYLNGERQKLAAQVNKGDSLQHAIQSISDVGGVAMVSSTDKELTYAVTFDRNAKEMFDSIDTALWEDEGPVRVNDKRVKIDNVISELRALPNIGMLVLDTDGWEVTDVGMKGIGRLDTLQVLILDGKDVTDKALKSIGQLDNLKHISIVGNQVSDNGLGELARLRDLEGLGISSARITDSGISQLQALSRLRSLGLSGTGLTKESIRHVGSFRQVEQLDLEISVDDAAIAEIVKLSRLKILSIKDGRNITDIGLESLGAAPSLLQLRVNGASSVTDRGIISLAKCRHLKKLNLEDTPITDAGLSALCGLTDLESLHLNSVKVSDVGVGQISKLAKLERLTLDETAIGDASINAIVQLNRLRVLRLHKTQITDAAVDLLARIPALQELHLEGTKISLQAIHRLEILNPELLVICY